MCDRAMRRALIGLGKAVVVGFGGPTVAIAALDIAETLCGVASRMAAGNEDRARYVQTHLENRYELVPERFRNVVREAAYVRYRMNKDEEAE